MGHFSIQNQRCAFGQKPVCSVWLINKSEEQGNPFKNLHVKVLKTPEGKEKLYLLEYKYKRKR